MARTYTTTQAMRGLKALLREAEHDGHAAIRRHDGRLFVVTCVPAGPAGPARPDKPGTPAAELVPPELAMKAVLGIGRGRGRPNEVHAAVVRAVAPRLARLPATVLPVLDAHIKRPRKLSVNWIARSAGFRRRTFDRRVRDAGFSSSAHLIKGFAVVAIWRAFMAAHGDLARTSAAMKMPKRTVQRLVRQGVGTTPRRARELGDREVARRIARKMVHG